ncbi:feruloyl esterase B [Nemania sp. FL0916]|nr:feruloyl esterase B [Nemania sp. FL0916]
MARHLLTTCIFTSLFPLLFLFLTSPTNASTFKQKCHSFSPSTHLSHPHPSSHPIVVNRLEYVPANTTLTFPDNDPSCNRASQLVAADICRVALFVPTSERSGLHFEGWFPDPEMWNGRTLATGNGGLDGCIKYEDIAYGAANGFLSVSSYLHTFIAFGTNNGHNGSSGAAFYHNEDALIDFSWRALHTSVEIGKELASKFYDRAHGKSYYIGCSLGGRQGIGGALKFPADFDGVVAGAPAVDFNSLYSWRASFFPITGSVGSSGFISAETWKTTIHDEVLRQCDDIDGVKDGIIEDPILCHVDTGPLLCKDDGNEGGDREGCLTAAQVDVVNAIFSDYLYPNGTLLYPRANPGGEILASDGLYAGAAYGPSADWFKYVVLARPDWDPTTYTIADAERAVLQNPADIATWPSSTSKSLAAFRARGGKILTYHGQQDQQISSLNSVRFWKRLAGEQDGFELERMDPFYRLFRVPGMNHCSGGPGAWTIGQGGSAQAYAIPFDREHNVLAAVVDWVEHGIAPDEIVGTKFVDDAVEKGIMYNHRHCRYPFRSTYSGAGDPADMESWHCVNFGGY